jgi:hypothetical protein
MLHSPAAWIKAASAEDEEEVAAASFSNKDKNSTKPEWEKPEWEKNITKPDWPTHNITKPDWPSKNWTKPAPQPKPFAAMVKKSLAANETTTTVTVADINGVAAPGGANIPKIASFSSKPNLATISSAAASKWSWATVDFNATASATSFTVTLPASYKKPVAWVVVSYWAYDNLLKLITYVLLLLACNERCVRPSAGLLLSSKKSLLASAAYMVLFCIFYWHTRLNNAPAASSAAAAAAAAAAAGVCDWYQHQQHHHPGHCVCQDHQ